MSATGRGALRKPNDFYATPEWCTELLLAWVRTHYPLVRHVVDPCAGEGAIAGVAYRAGYAVSANDPYNDAGKFLKDPRFDQFKPGPRSFLAIDTQDALAPGTRELLVNGQSGVITNPPYSLAQEFITHYRRAGWFSAWLLRLNFLGSQRRRDWYLKDRPNHVLILTKRPSFLGHGTDASEYAWVIYDRTPAARTEVDWL